MHWTTRANLGALVVVSVLGAIDAALSDQWDLFAVCLIVLLLVVPLATGLDHGRRLILVRRDLADWMDHRSSTTGEPIGAIADRALARHRDDVELHGQRAPARSDDA